MDDLTFQFGEDGVLLNTDPIIPFEDLSSAFVDITNIQGLSNAPFRTTERAREGQDGGFIDAELEDMRTIIIDGTVYAPTYALEPYLEKLKANYAPSKVAKPFYFQTPGINGRVVFCKSYGVKYDWSVDRRLGIVPIQIQLMAEDPTIYDRDPVGGTTALPQATTGRSYPRTYNYGYQIALVEAPPAEIDFYLDTYTDLYASASESGDAPVYSNGIISLINSGNKDTGALIRIYGPIVNPAVAHDLSGKQLMFALTVASDEYLEINLRRRTILLNGSTSRRHTLVNTSRWFMLAPGTNSLRLIGSDPISGAPDPTMTVEARSAYR